MRSVRVYSTLGSLLVLFSLLAVTNAQAGEENASSGIEDDHVVAVLEHISKHHSGEPCRFRQANEKVILFADGRVHRVGGSRKASCDIDGNVSHREYQGALHVARIPIEQLSRVLDGLHRIQGEASMSNPRKTKAEDQLVMSLAGDPTGVLSSLELVTSEKNKAQALDAWQRVSELLDIAEVK